MTDQLDIEVLIDDINGMYDRAKPGTRARVEQNAAAVKEHLAKHQSPISVDQVRAYIVAVMLGGMEAGVGPEPTPAANILGLRVAGACLLYRITREASR